MAKNNSGSSELTDAASGSSDFFDSIVSIGDSIADFIENLADLGQRFADLFNF